MCQDGFLLMDQPYMTCDNERLIQNRRCFCKIVISFEYLERFDKVFCLNKNQQKWTKDDGY